MARLFHVPIPDPPIGCSQGSKYEGGHICYGMAGNAIPGCGKDCGKYRRRRKAISKPSKQVTIPKLDEIRKVMTDIKTQQKKNKTRETNSKWSGMLAEASN